MDTPHLEAHHSIEDTATLWMFTATRIRTSNVWLMSSIARQTEEAAKATAHAVDHVEQNAVLIRDMDIASITRVTRPADRAQCPCHYSRGSTNEEGQYHRHRKALDQKSDSKELATEPATAIRTKYR